MRNLLALSLTLIAACAVTPEDGTGTNPGGGGGGGGGGSGSGGGGGGGGGSCPSEVVDAPTVAVCAAATLTCLEACQDDACYDTCMTAEPAAEACGACMEESFTSCVNAAGCQAQYDALMCCSEMCTDPEADDCYTVTCAAETTAYDTCSETNEGACDDAVCFKAQ